MHDHTRDFTPGGMFLLPRQLVKQDLPQAPMTRSYLGKVPHHAAVFPQLVSTVGILMYFDVMLTANDDMDNRK